MSEQPFSKLSADAWQLTRDGYTVTLQAGGPGGGHRAVVTNPDGEEVDRETHYRHPFREARWMLDSAIEAGE
jgi:hypothetical protein